MKLFYNNEYSLTKKDPIHEVFQRIRHVLDEERSFDGPNYFFLSDHFRADDQQIGVSAVARAIKNLPELSCYLLDLEDVIGDVTYKYKALSNFPFHYSFLSNNVIEGKNKSNISFEILSEIAEGIPRRYPFNHTVFLFDEMNWPQIDGDQNKEFDLNSILYTNNWWTPNRQVMLLAKIAVPQPGDDDTCVQPITDRNKNVLSILGHSKKQSLSYKLNQEEQALSMHLDEQAHKIIYSFREKITRTETIPFPHFLDSQTEGFYNLPRKQTISKIIKKLGYKQLPKEGSPGVLVYGKLTKQNNRILIEFDSGSTFYNLRCNFLIQGPTWIQRFEELPCSPGVGNNFFPVPNLETLHHLVENFCVVIEFLENTYVKEMETLYGPAPKWFRYEV